MKAILDIPEVRQRVSPLSVEEYHRLDEFNENGRRTELIRGVVIEKMAKSPLHSGLGKRLYDKIAPLLPTGYLVRKEDPLTLSDSEPEPDISVVKGREADFFKSHPTTAEIVIEVSIRVQNWIARWPRSTRKQMLKSIGLCSRKNELLKSIARLTKAITRRDSFSTRTRHCDQQSSPPFIFQLLSSSPDADFYRRLRP
jgi:hypothetical protein